MIKSYEASLPSKHGTFKVKAFQDEKGREHLAVYRGDLINEKVPVRIHSQCTTGDIFHSLKCDCGEQLVKALEYVESKGVGVILYMAQEGRGIGLLNKINAYHLQEEGCDTVEANEKLGFESDTREYKEAADILKALGVKSAVLLTNNKRKIRGLEEYGITVAGRVPLKIEPNEYNRKYLNTKKTRMDQLL